MKAVAGVVGFAVVWGLALLSLASSQGSSASPPALAAMPASFRALYLAAAATCPGLPPEILMAIGDVESGHGANDGPSSAGAVGPMQFELPTFLQYAEPIPPGGATPPDPWDPADAIYAAARDLCANGARDGVDVPGAVFAYNHDDAYVADVLSVAALYTAQDAVTATATAPAATAGGGG